MEGEPEMAWNLGCVVATNALAPAAGSSSGCTSNDTTTELASSAAISTTKAARTTNPTGAPDANRTYFDGNLDDSYLLRTWCDSTVVRVESATGWESIARDDLVTISQAIRDIFTEVD